MNASSVVGRVIVHKKGPIHLHNRACGTKATSCVVMELVGASEVKGKLEGIYSSFRIVFLYPLNHRLVHLVS